MIYIRVDANEEIATGHVMRCLSVAEALREQGEESTFILADDRPADLIQKRGFPVVILNTVWNDLDSECEMLTRCILEKNIKKLLIDSYYVTEHYLSEIGKHTKLIYIDDLSAFVYPVDLLVNYGFLSDGNYYAEMYKKAGREVKLCVGCDYAPLRGEFQNVSFEVRSEVRNVLLTTGGTDLYNVAGRILRGALSEKRFAKLRFHVVAGRFNQNISLLRKIEKENANVTVYENISNMSERMRDCDIAVTAGGSTTYELCAAGLPSICLSVAENQREGVRGWGQKGIMLDAGDMQTDGDSCIEKVIRYMGVYTDSYSVRKEKSEIMRGLVDGKGACRLAIEILNL